jgi:hypothetical protein
VVGVVPDVGGVPDDERGLVAIAGARTWRRLLVWVHVLTSVGWMSTALGLVALLTLSRDDPSRAAAAVATAHHLDMHLLGPAATASAFTGVMLSLATPWGLLHHWWIAAKFGITLVQLYVGIAILSAQLGTIDLGGAPSPFALAVASAAMSMAIAFQAWLSLAKPWPRTPWGRGERLPTAGVGWFVVAVLAAVGDLVLSQVLGFPCPLLMLPTLLGALVWLRLVAPASRETTSRATLGSRT